MPFNLKEYIENIAGQKSPGPSTTFSVFHIFYALTLLSEKPIGRGKLAEKLDVGEGAVRTIIKRLRDANLIATSREGCNLTEKGISVWKEFERVFPGRVEIEKTQLTSSEYNYAFLINDSGQNVKSGIEQRDAAIMGGAKRAIAIVARHDQLMIESVSNDIKKDFPKAAIKILKDIRPKNNDVIVIAGSDDPLKAMRGAFAASWVLIGKNKKK